MKIEWTTITPEKLEKARQLVREYKENDRAVNQYNISVKNELYKDYYQQLKDAENAVLAKATEAERQQYEDSLYDDSPLTPLERRVEQAKNAIKRPSIPEHMFLDPPTPTPEQKEALFLFEQIKANKAEGGGDELWDSSGWKETDEQVVAKMTKREITDKGSQEADEEYQKLIQLSETAGQQAYEGEYREARQTAQQWLFLARQWDFQREREAIDKEAQKRGANKLSLIYSKEYVASYFDENHTVGSLYPWARTQDKFSYLVDSNKDAVKNVEITIKYREEELARKREADEKAMAQVKALIDGEKGYNVKVTSAWVGNVHISDWDKYSPMFGVTTETPKQYFARKRKEQYEAESLAPTLEKEPPENVDEDKPVDSGAPSSFNSFADALNALGL